MDWKGGGPYKFAAEFAISTAPAVEWEIQNTRKNAMLAYDTSDVCVIAGTGEQDYIVKQIDNHSRSVRVHKLRALNDADAIDLACIMIGISHAELWHQERLVYQIAPIQLDCEPGSG